MRSLNSKPGRDEIVQLIKDESGVDLAALLRELSDISPDASTYSERILVLPRNLGDLEKPECLEEVKEKIEKLKLLKQMLNAGLISQMEYESLKAGIPIGDTKVSR
jgi:hypothetical protein